MAGRLSHPRCCAPTCTNGGAGAGSSAGEVGCSILRGRVREKGSINRTINQLLRNLTPKTFLMIENGQFVFTQIHGKQ